MANKEAEDFRSSLCDLTVNSKPLISMLTMLAEENQAHAEQIVNVIETHIMQAKPTEKLPSLYLIDSILKNLRSTNYASFFQQIIVNVFCHVFDQVAERTRQSMFKLRQTWSDILAARKLYALDVRVNQIDPAWPVSSLPESAKEPTSPSSIHVNPKFLHKSKQKPTASIAPSSSAADKPDAVAKLMEEKQKELEEIKQMQIELKLAKAKAQLEAQERELAELRAKLSQPSAANLTAIPAEAPKPVEPKPTDPRMNRGPTTTVPIDPRKPPAEEKLVVPSDPRRPVQPSTSTAEPSLNIPPPAIKGTVTKINKPSTAPAATSVGALLNQAVADQALEQLDNTKPVKRKGTKLPKLKDIDKEEFSQRGFNGRGGGQFNKRSFNNRDKWNERIRPYGYSKTERQLPYERPTAADKSTKSRDEPDRRRRRDRSRSRSRSRSPRSKSHSRSRSASPRRENRKSSKKKESRKDKPESNTKSRKSDESSTSAQSEKSVEETPTATSSSSAETSSSLTDRAVSKDKEADGKVSKPREEGSVPKGEKSKSSEDLDMRKRKKSPEPKKKTDSKSPERSSTKKHRKTSPTPGGRSPNRGRSPTKKKKDGLPAQDEDLRKKETTMDKDEDLRSNRGKALMKEQWETSRAKHMPRIPKRKYRERDETSPSNDSALPIDTRLLDTPDQDEKSSASKSDVDLRSLPMVRAPSRSSTDSSDSDAEVLAIRNKRRKQRNKIIEDGKLVNDDKTSKQETGDVDLRKSGQDKKRQKSRKKEETFDEDEDFRIRPPPPKSKSSADDKGDTDFRKKLSVQIHKDNISSTDQDEDLRVLPSPAAHTGWNKFKEANPRDFFMPQKVSNRRQSGMGGVTPLHMNDKGIDLLDQKDIIIEQANTQYQKGEITLAQFNEVKHRFQELELIKRAHQVKAGSMLGGDRQQRVFNPYDQRGGGPMVIQRQPQQNMQRQGVSPIIRPNLDTQMLNLLWTIQKNSNDPRFRQIMNSLQRNPGPRGQQGGMSPNVPNTAAGRGRVLLPTPDAPSATQSRNTLMRTKSNDMKPRDSAYEFVINGQPFELPLGREPRKIPIGGRTCLVQATDNREIIIDGSCYYKIGERVRERYISGMRHEISYRGPLVNFWLDQIQTDVRLDAPPLDIRIDDSMHTIQVEGHTNRLLVDGKHMGEFGGKPREIYIGSRRHYIAFEAPRREILIDGKLCRLKFDGPTPVIIIDNKAHGIRFDGPPREINIDDMSFMVAMDCPVRVKIGMRAHILSFGGPGHEVIIDGKPYEVMFNGPPRVVKIGGTSRDVRLVGDPPEVKILGEILPDDGSPMISDSETPVARDQRPASHQKPLVPPPRPPVRGGLLPTPPVMDPVPQFNADSDFRTRPPNSLMKPTIPDAGGPPRHPSWDNRGPIRDPHSSSANNEYNKPNFPGDFRSQGRPGDFQRSQGAPGGHRGEARDPVDPRSRSRPEYGRDHSGRSFREDVKPDLTKLPFSFDPSMPPPSLDLKPLAALSHPGDPRLQGAAPHANAEVSQTKPAALPPAFDINSLFKKLLDHGIISKKDEVDQMEKIPDLSSLKDEVLKKKYTGVIQRLYTGNQCATCGLRFLKSADTKYNNHLDWHFRQNTKEHNRSIHGTSRNWYIQLEDWVSYEEFSDIAESNVFLNSQTEANPAVDGSTPLHPEAIMCPKATGTEESDTCCVCREPFERYWDDEEEEWHLKDAVRVQSNTYHPVCYEDAVETSILESSVSIDEMSTAQTPAAIPQSPRNSIPPQSPRTPLLSPTSSNPPSVHTAIPQRRESNSSASSSTSQPPKVITTSKTEPATAFDLLSGLISKTETKAAPTTPQQNKVSDPLQMLAGLMKTVKPPNVVTQSVEVKVEPVKKSNTVAAEVKKVKVETAEVKPEPVAAAVKSIGTLGGLSTPTLVKSNVTLLPPKQEFDHTTRDVSKQHFGQELPRAPIRHHVHQPVVRPGQPPMRLIHPRPSGAEFSASRDQVPMRQISPQQMPMSHGASLQQRAPAMSMPRNPGPPMQQGLPPVAQRPSLQQGLPPVAQRPSLQQGLPPVAQRPSLQQGLPPATQRPSLQQGLPPVAQQPSLQQVQRVPSLHPQSIAPILPAQHGPLPQFRGAPPMTHHGPRFPGVGHMQPNVSGPPMLMNRPPIVSGPPAMMALAGAQPHMMMSTVLPAAQQPSQDEDEGTPVRDELDDDVARCATPVMDEPGDDGGSTPVRDEWD